MPEGDTIWRTAATLRERVGGRVVREVRPATLRRLVGHALTSVDPVGKHLYMHFDNGIALHTHMRMTGSWHVYAPGERRRQPAHLVTAELGFDDSTAVLYSAPVCELVASAGANPGVGPDILSPAWEVDDVVRRARASDSATVAEVLLDQRVCAGIGNAWRCEALWHERCDPFLTVADAEDAVLRALFQRSRDLLRRSAVGDAFAPAQVVHGRAGRPCRRCATAITTQWLGSPPRLLSWCPACQVRR